MFCLHFEKSENEKYSKWEKGEFTYCDKQIKIRINLGPSVLEKHFTGCGLTSKVKIRTLREKTDERERVLHHHGARTRL